MKRFFALFGRELAGYFRVPTGWIVLACFGLVQGQTFYLLLELLARPQPHYVAPLQLYFGGTVLYWLFVIGIVATITMRLVAEERRSGTIETLMALPVRPLEVLLGKYLGALAFFCLLWTPSLVHVLLLRQLGEGPIAELGPVLAGYLGTLVIGASWIAVGTLCSTMTRQQMVAALACFVVLVLLLLAGPAANFVQQPMLHAVLQRMDVFSQMDDFARGVVDSRVLAFHGSLVLLALAAAHQVLDRWRLP